MANQLPLDPYGNVIPASPGAKRVTQSDGTTVPMRTNLALSGITVTDNPTGDTTTLTASATAAGLGLTSVLQAELAHANLVCGFTNPSEALVVDMREAVGAGNAGFKSNSLVNSGALTRVFTTDDAGSKQVTSGATATSWAQLYSLADTCYVEPTFPDTINSRWHFECNMKVTTAPDANTSIGFGVADKDLTPGFVVGVRGAQSTTKYRLFIWGTSTGVNSSVSVDTNWHRFRAWCAGGTTVYFQVDSETPVSITLTSTGVVGPFLDVRNGGTAAAQTIRTRYAIYRYDGQVAA